METSVYSNIGFLSETSIKELQNYGEEHKANLLGINAGYKIIKRFDRIQSESQILHLDKPDEKEYIRLVLDEVRKRKISTVQIKTTKVTLEKILAKMDITEDEIKIGIHLFQEISAKCREYNSVGTCH